MGSCAPLLESLNLRVIREKGQFATSGSEQEPVLQRVCSAEEHGATQPLQAFVCTFCIQKTRRIEGLCRYEP